MDDDQQFCLRWNNHQSTLVSVFDTLFEKGIHVDCTLAAEGQTLKAHKVVLSACSPYFENVLSQQYDKHPIIILKDVKYAELRAMMDYMYRGEVNISQDQLAALLKAAESLQIKGLSDNKPSRPPSRPAQAVAAHPPRAPSPPPQARDGSAEGRAASLSPNRRRKLARRSSDAEPAVEVAKEEPHAPRGEPVEDLTLDEELAQEHEQEREHERDHERNEHQDPPAHHNDVVRNFQWHMERSQDELMNSNDSIRESQATVRREANLLPSPSSSYRQLKTEPSSIIDIKCAHNNYAKASFPITRGYLKRDRVATSEQKYKYKERKRLKKKLRKGGQKYKKRSAESGACRVDEKDRKYLCSICKKKQYKYRRNKLRHEKYECVTGPQFVCDKCGKRYSQKKTLTSHITQKHPCWRDLPINNAS